MKDVIVLCDATELVTRLESVIVMGSASTSQGTGWALEMLSFTHDAEAKTDIGNVSIG